MPVTITVEQGEIQEAAGPAVVVNLFQGVARPGGATGAVDQATGGLVSRLLASGDFQGKLGETAVLHPEDAPFERVILAGLGTSDAFTLDRARQAAAHVAKRARKLGLEGYATIVHGAGIGGLDPTEAAQALSEGTLLALYRFDRYRTGSVERDEDRHRDLPRTVTVVERSADQLEAVRSGVRTGTIVAESVNHARDTGALSGDDAAPAAVAERVAEMAAEAGLHVEVLDEAAVRELGMGGLLGVNRGSAKPPRFVVLEHNRDRDDLPTVVLVGKGVTFDTGGVNLKTYKGMHGMQYDKCGAAAVHGALRAAALLDLPVHVVGLTPLTDNMAGGDALKPHDVLTALNGKTIEVLNTDAEGRLILADALSYAARYDPEAVVDLATLTGAVVVGLGHVASGLWSNDDLLAQRVDAAAERTHEPVWRFPLYPEYEDLLRSPTADVTNVGPIRNASASVAATFLQHFTSYPWAHLDIAGTADSEGDRAAYNPAYSPARVTGTGVRLLVDLLRRWGEDA